MQTRMSAGRWGPGSIALAVFLVCGVAFSCVGAFTLSDAITFKKRAAQADGVVAALVVRHGDGDTYSPVFVFLDARGREFRVTSTDSSKPPAARIGQRVTVLYDEADPAKARIDSPTLTYLGPGIALAVGLLSGAIALVILARKLRVAILTARENRRER